MEKVAFLIVDFLQEKQNWTELIAFPKTHTDGLLFYENFL